MCMMMRTSLDVDSTLNESRANTCLNLAMCTSEQSASPSSHDRNLYRMYTFVVLDILPFSIFKLTERLSSCSRDRRSNMLSVAR